MQLALSLSLLSCCAQAQQQLPDTPQPAPPAATAPVPKPDDGDKFPFPGQTQPATSAPKKADDGDKFPFPGEDTSAAPAAKPEGPTVPKGFSSSATLHDEGSGSEAPAPDPKRVKEDAKVALFYWNLGNYEGAYLRYKDAVVYAPQDAEMWFHLAETERMLGKNVKAREDYGHYLVLSPNGSRMGEVAKHLKELPTKDKPQPAGPGPRVP